MAEYSTPNLNRQDSDEEACYSNEEKGTFLLPMVEHEAKPPPVPAGLSRRFWVSTAVNTICTVLIV